LPGIPPRLGRHVRAVLESGGKLPPKSLGAFIDRVLALRPSLEPRLARFSERRENLLSRLDERQRTNLAIQKETLATALEIAGMETDQLLTWSPPNDNQRFFLEGLEEAYVREDGAILSDYAELPGFEAIRNLPYAARVFQNKNNPSIRLTVFMANRLRLEEQTGADLIYYNETFQSFVMVQYKAMERSDDGPVFRWQAGDKLEEEIARMDNLRIELDKVPPDLTPRSFRLNENPFFLKLCPKVVFNPDDKGLFLGMYLPVELWRSLANDDVTVGKRDGRLLTYQNVGRRLTNTEFITLVSNAWVGTTIPQSSLLQSVIEDVIRTGKTATFAVKTTAEHSKDDDGSDILSPDELLDDW
jgi:hypothetical protein